MKRLIYWLTKRFNGSGKFCHHCCLTCEYYCICKDDGVGSSDGE